MATSQENQASKRAKQLRVKRYAANERNITVWLHTSTIETLDATAKSLGKTRAETITSAINAFGVSDTVPKQNGTSTDDSEIKSVVVSAMQRTIDELSKQINIKDHQINGLIDSTKQGNLLLGGMQKAMGLLEAPTEGEPEQQKLKTEEAKPSKKTKKKKNKKR